MLKKIIISTIITLICVGLVLSARSEVVKNKLTGLLNTGTVEVTPLINELLPPPLTKRLPVTPENQQPLSSKEVVDLTNKERSLQGLSALKVNAGLTFAAEAKINDMVNFQYFEHESPSGDGPSELATAAGYAFILVGENLAEGDFMSSQDLVKGWMDSPGHRANILNSRFEEIGVAVRKDNLFGKNVWIAVQEFGKPLSSCPGVDLVLKTQIEQDQITANTEEAALSNLLAEMDAAKSRGDTASYNSYVPVYNQKVNTYNALVEKIKSNVVLYNQSVKDFNTCINQ